MSELKLPSFLARPTRANGALVPALCAAVLLLCVALQLALTSDVEIPEAGRAGARARPQVPLIAGQFVPPIIQERPIFSPSRTLAIASDQTVALPLGGAAVAGTVSIKGRTYAVIQRPDGTITRLAVGQRYGGWRLRSLSPTGALFDKGAQKLPMSFGAAMAQPTTQTAENEEEQQ
jgi:hypothetical protein